MHGDRTPKDASHLPAVQCLFQQRRSVPKATIKTSVLDEIADIVRSHLPVELDRDASVSLCCTDSGDPDKIMGCDRNVPSFAANQRRLEVCGIPLVRKQP